MKPFLLLTFLVVACTSFEKRTSLSLQKNKAILWTADWSSNDKYIAWGGDDSVLTVYDAANNKIHKTIPIGAMIRAVRWHPQSKILAVAVSGGVMLYDVETGQLRKIPGVGGGRGIGWNYNGELLALADGRGIVKVMDKEGNVLKSIPKPDTKSYLALEWHPSKNIIATAGDEIILFDTTGKQLSFIKHRKEYTGILTVSWHPSGKFFASGDYGHEGEGVPTLLQFWNENGSEIKTIKGSKAEYRNIRWSKDGSLLATGSDALRIWNAKGELLHSSASSEDLLWGIAWNSDHTKLVTTSIQGNVKLWDSKARVMATLQ